MPATDSRVRKGSLTVDGDVFSCQPTAVSIVPEQPDGDDDTQEVLCGDILSGSGEGGGGLTATLNITAIQDFTNTAGLIAKSWESNGIVVPFEWNPTPDPLNNWTGEVKVAALTVGGEVGERLDTEAEWTITKLTLPDTLGGATVIGNTGAATGATAGTPGTFTPAGSTPPADAAAMTGITASPATAWTTGQYVSAGDASQHHWDGAAWATGAAALAGDEEAA